MVHAEDEGGGEGEVDVVDGGVVVHLEEGEVGLGGPAAGAARVEVDVAGVVEAGGLGGGHGRVEGADGEVVAV